MIADEAAYQNLVTRLSAIGGNIHRGVDQSNACCRNEHLIAFPAIHNLGVSGNQLNSGGLGSTAHGIDDPSQIVGGKALFKDERGRQIEWLGPAHCKVIHSTVDRQRADVSTRKEYWRHHK